MAVSTHETDAVGTSSRRGPETASNGGGGDRRASDPRGRAPVIIVGAGLAGLTAASFLRRRGVAVRIFEAGPQIAGLAATKCDPDGFTYDFGAHFITNRLAAAIGVGAQCRTIEHYGESVRVGTRTYAYPFGLMRRPQFVLSAIRRRVVGGEGDAPRSAAEVFRLRYGDALAERVAIPLLEAWSGAPAEDLAPAVAGALQHGVGHTLLLKIDGRLTRRAVAIGYSHEMPESPNVWHVYPMGGVAVLCQRLMEDLDGCVELNAPVEQILVERGRTVGVTAGGHEYAASAVVSTAPVHVLARLVSGTDALKPYARFRYRPMVFVNLRFEGRGVLPDTMLWTPDTSVPFFRLTETPLSMPWLAPDGKTMVTADIGCQVGDETWRGSDEELGQRCLAHLDWIPDVRARYQGSRVMRSAVAYPVYLNEYEEDRQRLAHGTGVTGLISIGRNGEFSHLLMEDVYWRTLDAMRGLIRERAAAA
jgi:oxygen-dependent protoporphyrinogen oxidase